MNSSLPAAVAEHIAAVNAHDTDRIVATFNTDALVNDARREFWGSEQIRQWVAREIVGDRVTMQTVQVLVHHGLVLVRARYDGDYDKTNLPTELILTNYFALRDDRIDALIIVRNQTVNGTEVSAHPETTA
jgi:hypothetical protein